MYTSKLGVILQKQAPGAVPEPAETGMKQSFVDTPRRSQRTALSSDDSMPLGASGGDFQS